MGIMEKMRLDGKKIFVTGGARGIGMNYAQAVAEAGADVAIVDVNIVNAEETCHRLAAETGREFIAVHADVTDEASVDRMMEIILSKFGRLDAAFCNAGITAIVPIEEMSFSAWKKIIDVNLNGVFLTDIAAGRQMLKQGYGSIINTASMSAHIVNVPQCQAAYNTSKAGVLHLTKSLAVEWATRGVRVNSISPGYIGTEMTLKTPEVQPMIEEWNKLTPMQRLGKPEELQAIAVYLAGDTSFFTTGADFAIDGGYTCF